MRACLGTVARSAGRVQVASGKALTSPIGDRGGTPGRSRCRAGAEVRIGSSLAENPGRGRLDMANRVTVPNHAITAAAELGLVLRALIIFGTASGGARVQEGSPSLFQIRRSSLEDLVHRRRAGLRSVGRPPCRLRAPCDGRRARGGTSRRSDGRPGGRRAPPGPAGPAPGIRVCRA
jgi:hypothetical protein